MLVLLSLVCQAMNSAFSHASVGMSVVFAAHIPAWQDGNHHGFDAPLASSQPTVFLATELPAKISKGDFGLTETYKPTLADAILLPSGSFPVAITWLFHTRTW